MAKKAKAKAVKKAKAAKAAPKKAAAKKAKAKKAKVKKVKAKKAKKAAKKGFRPPYKCQKTLVPGVCLKFLYNANSGEYDLGGDRVDCSSCEWFM
jgi:hypothetical protein